MIKRIALAIVVLAGLALAPVASASTVATPADGATYTTADTIHFDWAWSDVEYDTSWVGFARSPDGPWSPLPEDPVRDCSYGVCGPWLSSHADISGARITPGTWWWRLCNQSIYGEDDKCSLSPEPARKITINLPPPPGAPRIAGHPDGVTRDTSADLYFDFACDPGSCVAVQHFACRVDASAFAPCDSGYVSYSNLAVGTHTFAVHAIDDYGQPSADATYTWTVTAPPPPKPKPKPKPLPTLTRAVMRHDLHAALRQHVRGFNSHTFHSNCTRWSRTSFHCWVQWKRDKTRFSGTARVWVSGPSSAPQDHVTWRINKRKVA